MQCRHLTNPVSDQYTPQSGNLLQRAAAKAQDEQLSAEIACKPKEKEIHQISINLN